MASVSYKRIILLALPIIISGIIEPVVNTTDLVLIGVYDEKLIGAIGLGSQIIMTIVWLCMALLTPVAARIGVLFGENNQAQINNLFNYINLRLMFFGILISGVIYFGAEHIMTLFQTTEFISTQATEFLIVPPE